MTSPRFLGQTIVVTGGAHGIGLAVALNAAAEGAQVALVDRDGTRLKAACFEVGKITDACLAIEMDVRDAASVESGMDQIESRFGRIDGLVTSAGVLKPGSIVDLSLSDWDETYAVNVRGTMLACRAVIPGMLRQHNGSIVLISSTSGLQGEAQQCAYNSSKAAVINLARQLAIEYAACSIRVNTVCPGWVAGTGFNAPVLKALSEAEITTMVARDVPLGRQGTPQEIADAVCFLLSNEASYITGIVLPVDGGDSAD